MFYEKLLYAADVARASIGQLTRSSKRCVVIAGSPRSGTSWVMRIIGQLENYCTIFEPLHPRWWEGVRQAGFGNRPCQGDERKHRYILSILNGTKPSRHPRWSTPVNGSAVQFIRGATKQVWADRHVIKFVRALRLLPWMVEQFPNQRYVYVVRDPYAVVSSQLRNGISSYVDDGTRPVDLLDDSRRSPSSVRRLCEAIRADASQVIDKEIALEIESLVGCLTLSWYADNLVAQRVAERDKVLTLSYEDLVTDTRNELERLNHHIREDIPLTMNIGVKDPCRQINKWKGHLSDLQAARVSRVLHVLEDAHLPLGELCGHEKN